MPVHSRTAVTVLLLLALSTLASADEHRSYVTSVVREAFALRVFDEIDLPQGSVRAVHVSRQGYLWAGTREGLVQFKSGQQRIWPQSTDNVTGLPSGTVNTIYEDERGGIWVGTARGVALLENGASDFRIIIQSDDDWDEQLDIVDFVVFPGRLLAASASGELIELHSNGGALLSFAQNSQGPQPVNFHEQQLTSAAAYHNELFVGTVEGGILRLQLSANSFSIIDALAPDAIVVDVQVTDDTLIWLDRNEGLFWRSLVDSNDQGHINPLVGDSQGYFRAMHLNSPRDGWFAAGPQIVRIRGDQTDVVRLPGRGNGVRSITVDYAGNIWIGTYYRLFYALDTDFNTLRTAAAYDSGVISSLAAVGQDLYIGGQNLWVGKSGGSQFDELASRYPASRIKDLRVDPLSVGQDPITTLVATENLLLVGYFVGGLDVVDLNTGAVSNVLTAPGGVDLSSIGVSGIVQVADDTWLASFYLYGLVELSIVRTEDAPQVTLRLLSSHETLIGVYEVTKNRFLAVDQKELLIVDRKSDGDYALRKFRASPVGIVFSVEPDGIGGAYLGIENVGIRHLSQQMLDEARFEPLSLHYVEPYLARKTVWHLLLEDRKLLWATTNNGVYVFDLIQENLVSHITYRDGLPANEFEYGTTSSLITASGEKLFISAPGPVSFRAPVQPRDKEVQLTWTDVTVNGESVLDQLERMESGRSEITLPFSAVSEGVLKLEYGYDDHIKALDSNYAIRFSEDGEWLRESSPTITMTQQQSWEPVHLEIAMLNTNGAVISAPMRMDISVEPPWYMWWVVDIRVAIPSVLLMSLLLLGVQLRAKRRQQRIFANMDRDRELTEAEIRGRLGEKEIQLREIHHRVGNILSSFASHVRTLRRSANSLETLSTLEQLSARIKVQSAVHTLLQRADNTDINAANMIRQVVAGARDMFAERDPRPIDLDLDDVCMTYSKAQYLGLIVNELLTNSYKHGLESTTPSLAQISFKLSDSGAGLLSYRDFGPGVDEAMIERVMSAPRSEANHGLGQIVAMAWELKAEPVIKGCGGLHFSMEVTNKLLRTSELRSESLPP